MRYGEFRDGIHTALRRSASGLTWSQLRQQLGLPYDRPCPAWTKRLERRIGLARRKGDGRELVWTLAAGKRRTLSIPASAR
jgi:hypothetical protein